MNGLKKPLVAVAIGNWVVGAVVFWMVVNGLGESFDLYTIGMLVGWSMLTAGFVLQPALLNKSSMYGVLMPLISIATVWLTWPMGNWVAEHPGVREMKGFAFTIGSMPLAVATAVMGTLVLSTIFLHGALRTKVVNDGSSRRSNEPLQARIPRRG